MIIITSITIVMNLGLLIAIYWTKLRGTLVSALYEKFTSLA